MTLHFLLTRILIFSAIIFAGFANAVVVDDIDLSDPKVQKLLKEWDRSDPRLIELLDALDPSTQERAERTFSDQKAAELAFAASIGDINKIDELVAEGVDVDARGEGDRTPLAFALHRGKGKNIEAVARLLHHGADPNLSILDGRSSVMMSFADRRDPEYLALALNYGGDANASSRNQTVIFGTIIRSSAASVRLLIDAGADFNFQDRVTGKTPLHVAGRQRRFETVYLLLEAGADPRINDNNGQNGLLRALEEAPRPRGEASYEWRQKVIEYLRGIGMEVTPQDP